MAFITEYKIPGPFPAVEAYHTIGKMLLDRANREVKISFMVFKDQASRETFKACQDREGSIAQEIADKHHLVGSHPGPEAVVAMEELKALMDEQDELSEKLLQAVPLFDQCEVVIKQNELGQILDLSGGVDLAKAYVYLKTLPQFATATDV